MYRTSRDTASWFDKDNKGTLMDRSISKNVGPGKYDSKQSVTNGLTTHQTSIMSASTNHRSSTMSSASCLLVPHALTTKTSWNTGQVPFGCGSSRVQFNPVRCNTISGPGSYEHDRLAITKP
jgi:hypothetical protein